MRREGKREVDYVVLGVTQSTVHGVLRGSVEIRWREMDKSLAELEGRVRRGPCSVSHYGTCLLSSPVTGAALICDR